MKFGLFSLGDHMADPATGANRIQAERYADLITLAEWGEELGFETFHVGEHHFCDYIVSNPVPLLTAAAMRTKRIKLSTAVTLLANRDPVLVAEDYAALDLISNGRAELVVGRGNFFVECYRQMGQDFAKSRAAFEENLDLLLRAWTDERISSSGATRPPLDNARIQPKPLQRPYPLVWIGGGSSEDSALSAASRGLPLQLPGVFAGAAFFRKLADTYRSNFKPGPHGPSAQRIGYTAHCHVGLNGDDARRVWWPYHEGYFHWVNDIAAAGGGPRGPTPSLERNVLDPDHHTALCGSPDEVYSRIARWRDTLGGLDTLLVKFDGGGLPMPKVRESLDLFASEVMPRLR